MARISETRFLVEHESCECKCRLTENVCNSKQKWNHDKCQCEGKESVYWSSCKYDCMWNSSTCDCECDKASKIQEHLYIKNCLHLFLISRYYHVKIRY